MLLSRGGGSATPSAGQARGVSYWWENLGKGPWTPKDWVGRRRTMIAESMVSLATLLVSPFAVVYNGTFHSMPSSLTLYSSKFAGGRAKWG